MLKQIPTRQRGLIRLASAQWSFLPGKSHTLEVRVIGEGGVYIRYCNSRREFVDAVLEAHEKGGVYVGVQPRLHASTKWIQGGAGGKAEDVLALRTIFLDFNPARAKNTAATEEQRLATRAVVDVILGALEKRGLPAPLLIDSGNGVHAYWAIPEVVITDKNRAEVAATAKAFEGFIRDLVPADSGVKCDAVADLARICRVWGSLNMKGGASVEAARQVVAISKDLTRVESAALWAFAASLPKVVVGASKSSRRRTSGQAHQQDALEMPEELLAQIECSPVLHQLFLGLGGKDGDKSESGKDGRLLLAMGLRGYREQDLRHALLFRPGGTAAHKHPGYLERTVAWALDKAAEYAERDVSENDVPLLDDLVIERVTAVGTTQRVLYLHLAGGVVLTTTVGELLDHRKATVMFAEAMCRLPYLPGKGGTWQKFVDALLRKAEIVETSPEASERGMRLELVQDVVRGLPEAKDGAALNHGCALLIDGKKIFRLASVHRALQTARTEIPPVDLGALLRELGAVPVKKRIAGHQQARVWEIDVDPTQESEPEYAWKEESFEESETAETPPRHHSR